MDDVEQVGATVLKQRGGQSQGFVIDAWLANWDVVGANYDNLVMGVVNGQKRLIRWTWAARSGIERRAASRA